MNYIQLWLYLIGTPERARALRAKLGSLAPARFDEFYGAWIPKECPTRLLFGAKISAFIYSDPQIIKALDAWDQGIVDADDIRRWCFWIEEGNYKGLIFDVITSIDYISYNNYLLRINASSLPWLDDPEDSSLKSPRSRAIDYDSSLEHRD